jgi:glycerol-3-phosphate acyltransferase PlsY
MRFVTFIVVGSIVFLAYLLGSIPFGLLVSKSQGLDIREHGSRNIGATNVWRVMGRKFGLVTFIADVLKGLIAVLLAKWLAAHWEIHVPLPHGHERVEFFPADYAGIAAAMGCVLGHSFPVWLRFKGGKGVATSLGVIFGMMPVAALLTFAVWGVVFQLSRYVSLASIVGAAALPVIVVGLMLFGPADGWLSIHGWGNFFFAVAAALLVVRRHRENIKRLIAGTENRFGAPKPPEPETES